MKGPEITAVIFDWSGTVSDDRRPVWTANMAILDHYGIERIPFEEFIPQVKTTVLEMAIWLGIADDPRNIGHLYLKHLALAKQKGVLPQVYPEARKTLITLAAAGVKLAVLSSHPQVHLLKEAEDFRLLPLLSKVFGGSIDKAEGLRLVLADLGVLRPSEAIYISDTVFDLRAAKLAGVRSGAIFHGYHTRDRLKKEEPDFLFEDLSEIPEGLLAR